MRKGKNKQKKKPAGGAEIIQDISIIQDIIELQREREKRQQVERNEDVIGGKKEKSKEKRRASRLSEERMRNDFQTEA